MMKKRILVYGDSNTYGYRSSDHLRFEKPYRWTTIADEYAGAGFEIINGGMNGRTACGHEPLFPLRNGIDYIESCILSHMPLHMICVMLGTNDLKKEFAFSAERIAQGCGQILKRAKKVMDGEMPGNDCKYLLMSPIEVSGDVTGSGWAEDYEAESAIRKSRELSELYCKVAEEEGFLFFDAALFACPCKEDGIHLSAESHRSLGLAFGKYLLETENREIWNGEGSV